MKYAKEVIELMSSYPGREFKTIELARHCVLTTGKSSIRAAQKGVQRVMFHLIANGQVELRELGTKSSSRYVWNICQCSSRHNFNNTFSNKIDSF